MTVHHQTSAHLGRRPSRMKDSVPIGDVHRERLIAANKVLGFTTSNALAVAAQEIGLEAMLKAKGRSVKRGDETA